MAEYIEREEVCNVCNNQKEFCGKEKCPVYRATTADIAPVRHGWWKTTDTMLGRCCVCSVCGGCPTMEYRYCPYCGSRMDEGADNGE